MACSTRLGISSMCHEQVADVSTYKRWLGLGPEEVGHAEEVLVTNPHLETVSFG